MRPSERLYIFSFEITSAFYYNEIFAMSRDINAYGLSLSTSICKKMEAQLNVVHYFVFFLEVPTVFIIFSSWSRRTSCALFLDLRIASALVGLERRRRFLGGIPGIIVKLY